MHVWQLHDAKERFSELVRAAKENGPQDVTVRGQSGVIVMSRNDYDALVAPKERFLTLIDNSPLKGLYLEIERDTTTGRKTEL